MKHCGGMIGDSIGAMMKQPPCKNKMCCGENRWLALRSIGALVNSPHRLDWHVLLNMYYHAMYESIPTHTK